MHLTTQMYGSVAAADDGRVRLGQAKPVLLGCCESGGLL